MVPEPTDPGDLIPGADEAREQANDRAREALEHFLDAPGLYEREQAIAMVAAELEIDAADAAKTVAALVGDIVDPVQNVPHPDGQHVGVIEYVTFEAEGAYGYVHYSDRFGSRKRVVCARCVETEDLDEHVAHATQGEGTVPEDAEWDEMLNRITAHYAADHEQGPESVEPGASLVAGTTMGGNQAWHQGNVSAGTGVSIGTQSVALAADGHGNAEHTQDFTTEGLSDRRLAMNRRLSMR